MLKSPRSNTMAWRWTCKQLPPAKTSRGTMQKNIWMKRIFTLRRHCDTTSVFRETRAILSGYFGLWWIEEQECRMYSTQSVSRMKILYIHRRANTVLHVRQAHKFHEWKTIMGICWRHENLMKTYTLYMYMYKQNQLIRNEDSTQKSNWCGVRVLPAQSIGHFLLHPSHDIHVGTV